MFEIRRDEVRKTLLMTASVLVIIASYTMVKAVRDAVFLARFDTRRLAYVNLFVAATAGAFTAVATRLGRGAPRNRLILAVHGIVALTLLALWIALQEQVRGAAWALYVWSSFFGLFVLANYWLLANDLYDVRSAKRLFALLGAGAIVGGVVGGEMSRALSPRVGALGLVPIVAAGFVLSALLAHGAWRAARARPAPVGREERVGYGAGFRALREHRYVRLIAMMLLCATIATTLIDFQVKEIAKAHFASNRDAMAAFFGRLTSLFSLLSLGVQLLVTPRFLRRFGVGRALLVLPVTLVIGACAILFHAALAVPVVTAVALAKIGDGGLRFSLDKAALELLYLPVASAVKARAKPVVDTVVDRLGTGATALLWLGVLALAARAGLGTIAIAALATLGLLGAWLGVIARARREYVEAFRTALPGPPEDPHAIPVDVGDRAQLRALREALRSPDARAVRVALEALARLAAPPALDELRRLVDHPAPEVRALAFDVLAAAGERRLVVKARRRAADESAHVRAAAVRYLAHATEHGTDDLAGDPDVRVRVAALAHLAERGRFDAARASGHLEELLAGAHAQDRDLRVEIAATLGALPAVEARRYLGRLLTDRDPEVARVAGASAARLGEVGYVRLLLERLGDRRWRAAARAALEGYGAAIVGALAAALDDPTLPRRARQAIPGLLAAVGTQGAVDVLVGGARCRDLRVRGRVLRTLARLARTPTVRVDGAAVEAFVVDEARAYALHLEALRAERAAEDTPGSRLLRRALAERLQDDLERVFRLLGLRYPPRDVLRAWYGVRSDEAGVRASALELLDNLLDNPLKRDLIGPLDADAGGAPGRRAELSRADALRALAADPDPWLRACAVYVIGETRVTELRDDVVAAARDPDTRVQEAAALAARFLAEVDAGAEGDEGRAHAHDD